MTGYQRLMMCQFYPKVGIIRKKAVTLGLFLKRVHVGTPNQLFQQN
jgi:hypothetical protein